MSNILLIGIGNISRGDDGIGWLFADDIELCYGQIITVEKEFQLVVEDALKITGYDMVVFVDASKNELDNGFDFRKITMPEMIKTAFTSHAQSPLNIFFLASDLFQYRQEAYIMEIGGKEWGLGKGISEYANQNLQRGLAFFKGWLAEKLRDQRTEYSTSV